MYSRILPLPPSRFLLKIPFLLKCNYVRDSESHKNNNRFFLQAIECILGGVKFSDSEEFVDQILENNLVGFYARGKRLPDKPQLTKGPLYEISLLSFEGICLNRKLIDDGVLEGDTETDSAQFLEDDEMIDICATQSEEIEVGRNLLILIHF